MKTSTFLLLTLLTTAAFIGCKKDNGFDNRDSFVATYSVTETWKENNVSQSKPAFTMSVEKSSQSVDKILLNNFANYSAGITAVATVKNNAITITQQTLSNSKTISGSGSLTDATLTITYTETQGSTSIVVTASAIKL